MIRFRFLLLAPFLFCFAGCGGSTKPTVTEQLQQLSDKREAQATLKYIAATQWDAVVEISPENTEELAKAKEEFAQEGELGYVLLIELVENPVAPSREQLLAVEMLARMSPGIKNPSILIDAVLALLSVRSRVAQDSQLPVSKALLEVANASIAANPTADVLAIRGDEYADAGNLEKAYDDFNRAIALDSDCWSAYMRRGTASLIEMEYESAERDFTKAIAIRDDVPGLYLHRAACYLNTGMPKNAIDDLTRAIELEPKYISALEMRASAYGRIGESAKSATDAETANALRSGK